MGVIYTTEQFDTWYDGLRDARAKAAIKVRMRRPRTATSAIANR